MSQDDERSIAPPTASGGPGIPSWAKWIVAGVLVVALLLPLLDLLLTIGLSAVWDGYVGSVGEATGLNRHLVAFFSSLLFVPFYLGVTWSFSIRPSTRRKGYATLGLLLSLYYLGLYLGTRDQNFDPATGASTRFWCKGPHMYDKPGIDPVYGCQLRPLTPEEIERRLRTRPGDAKRVTSRDSLFDRATGEPSAWYLREPGGRIVAYDQPGFTDAGEELEPITREVAREMREQEEAEQEAIDEEARTAERERDEAERRRVEDEQRRLSESQRQRDAARREVEALRGAYDQSVQRARMEIGFWDEWTARMAQRGTTFRPEITVALDSARSNLERCRRALDGVDPGSLRNCILSLDRDVATLHAAR